MDTALSSQHSHEAVSGLVASRATRSASSHRGAVLIVDDEHGIVTALRHLLTAAGYACETATDGTQAVAAVMSRPFDVVLSDIHMPGLSGLAMLRALRAHDQDVPVILMTGDPTLSTAMEAISLGAMHYLAKPMENAQVLKLVERASTFHRLAKVRRDADSLVPDAPASERLAELGAALDHALGTMWMAFQPIVLASERRLFGYEALMRSTESSLPTPLALLQAAEKLNRLDDLGRRIRALSAEAFDTAPADALLFVNLHTCDLLDPDLFAPTSPLSRIAPRVVLEITERASLDAVPDVIPRVADLRARGFRIAIDDLGAGYAGLSSVVALEPDFVKLDMSLVRGVHKSSIRQRIIGSLSTLCDELGMRVLAEGIETAEERDAMRDLRCDLLQGFLFARPGKAFPSVSW